MKDSPEIFLFSDQPTTCPKCGLRTEIILDLIKSLEKTQLHKCPSPKCGFEFLKQED